MDMKLEELGFDDEDLLGEDGVVQTGDPDDDIKRWIDNDTPVDLDEPLDNQEPPKEGDGDTEPTEDDLITTMLKAKEINPETIN